MAETSSDPITAAMIETEKEVAGFAWDNEDTEAADPTGDRSLEDIGDGLEGQHEADEVDEDADAEAAEAAEAEAAEAAAAAEAAKKAGDGEQPKPGTAEQPQGRVPPGKHREALERARAAETERDALKAAFDKREAESKAQLDLVMLEIAALKTAPRADVKAPEPVKVEADPDIFEDPKGFTTSLKQGIQAEINKVLGVVRQNSVANSFEIAHVRHGDTFPKAMEAIEKTLKLDNPEHRAIVQRIYDSPNPGEAVVNWYKREQTRAEVGDDVVAYRERVAKETREALMKDPEFRKQLIADLRGEANAGDNGTPRTTTRIPRSLAAAQGSNVGADRIDTNAFDGSPQAIAESAWR